MGEMMLGYLEYYYYCVRGKLNLWQASELLSRRKFSSSKIKKILRDAGAIIGKESSIRSPLLIEDGAKLVIGDRSWVNFGLTIVGAGKVDIGNHVLLGPRVTLVTVNHPLDPIRRETGHAAIHMGICIEDNVWIGANVTVCAGVTIRKNSVVGAGSVVTRDVIANTFSAGIPCRPLRQL